MFCTTLMIQTDLWWVKIGINGECHGNAFRSNGRENYAN